METIVVVKIGGNIIDDADSLKKFLFDFSQIQAPKVLIHGGGKLATQLSKLVGIEATLVDGRRITDEKTLDIVTMVYAGLINKKIVAQLQSMQCNAIGFSGADANSILSHKRVHPTIDFGFVGDIDVVNADFFADLLDKNYTPIIAPITHDGNGQLLNTNADTMASAISISLSKKYNVAFYYCFEKEGLMKDVEKADSIIQHVAVAQIEILKAEKIITDGMIPKVDNIANALQKGVNKVILCHAKDVLKNVNENANFGTTFTIN